MDFRSNSVSLSSDIYMSVDIYKSTKELTVTRSVVKVDEMLSYVGGLFGLLFVAISFFLSSFNEYRYEIYASEAAFKYDNNGKSVKESNFGLFTYFKYSLFDWLTMFGCQPNWKDMKEIDATR